MANSFKKIQGLNESPLSEDGMQQAQRCAVWLKRHAIDALYSSPLMRAAQTAEIIGIHNHLSPQVHADLREIDTGIFSGLDWQEVQTKHRAVYERFTVDSWEAVPDAERIESLIKRSAHIWRLLIDTAHQKKQAIVAVAHGGILQWIIKSALGADRAWMPLIPAKNCAIFCLRVRPAQYTDNDAHNGDGCTRGYYAAWEYMNYQP